MHGVDRLLVKLLRISTIWALSTALMMFSKQPNIFLLSSSMSLFVCSPYSLSMALFSLKSSRFILHSANALVPVSLKVQEASKFPDIKIVTIDWLTASINSHVRADEAQFSFGQKDTNQDDTMSSMSLTSSKQNDTKGKGKKRPRSPTPIEEDFSDIDETAEMSPKKRHKDVQKAKSGSLLIPVDETCPLAGKTADRKLFRVEAMTADSYRNSSRVHWRGRNDL